MQLFNLLSLMWSVDPIYKIERKRKREARESLDRDHCGDVINHRINALRFTRDFDVARDVGPINEYPIMQVLRASLAPLNINPEIIITQRQARISIPPHNAASARNPARANQTAGLSGHNRIVLRFSVCIREDRVTRSDIY